MEGTASIAIHVRHVSNDAGAENVQIDVRVLGDQWIIRPVHLGDAASQQLLALALLQPATETRVAQRSAHGKHVRPMNHRPVVVEAR